MKLIDDFLPVYDAAERHAITVRVPAELVYRAIRSADLAGAPPVRLLLALRALPAALTGGGGGLRRIRDGFREAITLAEFERRGFAVLAENPPHELLIGLVGSFWKAGGGLLPTSTEAFRGPQQSGTARAAWNFYVRDCGHGSVVLSTETRVAGADAAATRSFRRYWRMIRPWSGLTRRFMLRAIRREAERLAAGRTGAGTRTGRSAGHHAT